MNDYSITENEIQTLRAIARQAEETESLRISVVREDVLGDGGLSRRTAALMDASLRLDGMVTVAEQSTLFSRVGTDIRRMVLAGREPREDDFQFYGVPVVRL